MRLDAHQHFWHYDPAQHVWMTDRMGALKRDFLPEDLLPLLQQTGMQGTIAVQARQNVQETQWLLELADRYPFIQGVVGWVDLRAEHVAAQLAQFAGHAKFCGVRHVIHDEPDDDFMLQRAFRRGLGLLARYHLTYDLLLFPRHLPVVQRLVAEFPEQSFVLDHIAKPAIARRQISPWREDLAALARFPNVFCKLSGLVTEAPWAAWQPADFRPYLDAVLEAFGPHRVMIGSDWPVCTLSGTYGQTLAIVFDYIQQFPANVRRQILGETCARFYGCPGSSP